MNKALFLDRDGVINVDHGYVYEIKAFTLIDGILDLCLAAKSLGYLLIVVTNQSGIERGYFTEEDFQGLTRHMCTVFTQNGAPLDDVFHCPHLDHEDRKPNPGMFLKAAKKHDIDMGASLAIGDRVHDIEAAQRARVGRTILFSENAAPGHATFTVRHLCEAKKFL